jgi:hypothetical protein
MKNLAVEVRLLHNIAVYEPNSANPCSYEIRRRWTAQASDSNDQH